MKIRILMVKPENKEVLHEWNTDSWLSEEALVNTLNKLFGEEKK